MPCQIKLRQIDFRWQYLFNSEDNNSRDRTLLGPLVAEYRYIHTYTQVSYMLSYSWLKLTVMSKP